jgi:hypothetical protein
MLVIRKSQMDSLYRAQIARYLARLAETARRELPGKTEALDDAMLQSRLERAMAAAADFGFEDSACIERFALIHLEHGPEFCAPPDGWGVPVLEDPKRSELMKTLALEWLALRRTLKEMKDG